MGKFQYRAMAAASAAIGLLAGLAAALGVFARGDGTFVSVTSVRGISYEMATSGVYAYSGQRIVAEGVGWDVFTLLVAAPAILLASFFVARGSFRGRLFALGLLAYFLYQYVEYSVAWAFGPLFLLWIVIYAASLGAITWLALSIGREGVAGRFTPNFPGRMFAVPVVALVLLLGALWLQRVGQALSDFSASGLTETTMVVQALDLGLVLPISLLVAVLAWRGGDAGRAIASVYAVAAVAMTLAILAMLVSAGLVEGAFEVPPMIMFGSFALVLSAIGLLMYRSVARSAPVQAPRQIGRKAVSSTRA